MREAMCRIKHVSLVVRCSRLIVVDVDLNLQFLGVVIHFGNTADRTDLLVKDANGAPEGHHGVLILHPFDVGRNRRPFSLPTAQVC